MVGGGHGGGGRGGTLTVNEEPQLLVDSYCYSEATEGVKKQIAATEALVLTALLLE